MQTIAAGALRPPDHESKTIDYSDPFLFSRGRPRYTQPKRAAQPAQKHTHSVSPIRLNDTSRSNFTLGHADNMVHEKPSYGMETARPRSSMEGPAL